MAPVTCNPTKISGPWQSGYVLDRHTISSTPTGDPYNPFDTKRTELGELVYQLKYGGKMEALPIIVDTAEEFIRNGWQGLPGIDCIVPAPPSVSRKMQPVVALARELAARLGLQTCEDAVVKVKRTEQMKNVTKTDRPAILEEAIQLGTGAVKNKRVLLFDDLVESGSTLSRVTEVLLGEGGASAVHVLVLTRTK